MSKIDEVIKESLRKDGKKEYILKIWFNNEPNDISEYKFFTDSDDEARNFASDRIYSELVDRAQEKTKEEMGKCFSELYREGEKILFE